MDCLEQVIKNDMVLWSYLLSFNIENKSYLGRMQVRETKKETKASSRGPFRDFLAILKSSIKNVNRAAKNMGTPQYCIISAHRSP